MCVVWVGLLASGSVRISLSFSLSLFLLLLLFLSFSFLSFRMTSNRAANKQRPIKFHALFCSVLCRVSCYWRRVTRERKFRSRIQSTTAITDTIEWRLGSTAWENLTGVWSAGSNSYIHRRRAGSSGTRELRSSQKTRKPKYTHAAVYNGSHVCLDN